MGSFSDEMSERFMVFAVTIMKLEKQLMKSYSGRHIFGQLFRSATSVGANYEEARAAESSADFIHKIQIVLKELRESRYWINLIAAGKFITTGDDTMKFLVIESIELVNIIAKSVVTAKSKVKS
jgi:four helix bundle protein